MSLVELGEVEHDELLRLGVPERALDGEVESLDATQRTLPVRAQRRLAAELGGTDDVGRDGAEEGDVVDEMCEHRFDVACVPGARPLRAARPRLVMCHSCHPNSSRSMLCRSLGSK